MRKLINFDNWILDTNSGTYGSGASEKIWLVNPENGQRGIFKFPKVKTNGEITGEYYAEAIASELGNLIGISCAKVDIGIYNGKVGSISYNFLQDNERLTEGVDFIQEVYPNYDRDMFVDKVEGIKYNVQLLEQLNININDILKMVIFDALIGNSDRHHSNWGYVVNMNGIESFKSFFSPLYDNGSSLCSYVNDTDIVDILRDKNRYNALIDTKSKSCIGWEDERPIRHFDLIKKVRDNYYEETIDFVKEIDIKLTDEIIFRILNNFPNDVISDEKKKLIYKFICERRFKILEIYNLNGEMTENE